MGESPAPALLLSRWSPSRSAFPLQHRCAFKGPVLPRHWRWVLGLPWFGQQLVPEQVLMDLMITSSMGKWRCSSWAMGSQYIKTGATVKTATEPGGDGGAEMPRSGRATQALSSVSSSWFYPEVPVLHVWIIQTLNCQLVALAIYADTEMENRLPYCS